MSAAAAPSARHPPKKEDTLEEAIAEVMRNISEDKIGRLTASLCMLLARGVSIAVFRKQLENNNQVEVARLCGNAGPHPTCSRRWSGT